MIVAMIVPTQYFWTMLTISSDFLFLLRYIYIYVWGCVGGGVVCVGGGGVRVCVCVYEKERKYPEIYEYHYKNQFRNFMYIVS